MARTVTAAVVGTVVAIGACLAVVAVVSAVNGVPVMFDPERKLTGWDGAAYGVAVVTLLAIGHVWPVLVVVTVGAAAGILLRRIRSPRPSAG